MIRKVLCALLISLGMVACRSPQTPVRDSALATPSADGFESTESHQAPSVHAAEINNWRETRVGNLRKPDGWLSLVGLHWLSDGEQTVGAAADSAVVLATGPKHLGTIRVVGKTVSFKPDSAVTDLRVQSLQDNAWIDVSASATGFDIEADSGTHPGRILIGTEASVALIERGGKLALRVKDASASTRTGFVGIDYYPINLSWRIEAEWTAHATPQTFEIQNVLGMIEQMPSPGYASFSRDGKNYRLHPVLEAGSDELFFIFADRTNGRETYGAGRFFYATPPVAGGKVVLDFNKAYNPPCAFTEFSTCPLPPPENRLDLAVTAGEKKYLGSH
jgi:uncharacterized protein